MNMLTEIAGLLVLAAITPGPNNLVVMRIAARSGMIRTLPAIAGVVCGGLVLLALVIVGAGALFAAEPRLRLTVTVAGCAGLAWLAISLMMRHRTHPAATTHELPATGFTGLFVFQLLNPKAWLMLLAVVSAMTTTSMPRTFVLVAALFVPVSVTCLLVWAFFGTRLTALLLREKTRTWFDRATGGALLVMAALLLLNT